MADGSTQIERGLLVTPQQLAFEIFSDTTQQDLPLSEANQDIGFVRSNLFSAINELSAPARRIVDAAYFIAAQEGSRDVYEADFSYFCWLARFNSRDVKNFRTKTQEAQGKTISVTDTPINRDPSAEDQWVSVQLLNDVEVRRGRIYILIPKKIVQHIVQPFESHWLSLRISTALSLSMARAVYDRLLLYSRGGITEWYAVEDVVRWPGKVGQSAKNDFSRFSEKFLRPAVDQINEVSDFHIDYDAKRDKTTNTTSHIRFRVSLKEGSDAKRAGLSTTLFQTLRDEIGLEPPDINMIAMRRAEWTDARLEQALEFTRFKIDQGKVTKSARGFFMRALEEDWKVSTADRKIVEIQLQQDALQRNAVQEQVARRQEAQVQQDFAEKQHQQRMQQSRAQAAEMYKGVSEAQQRELIRGFLNSKLTGQRALRREKLEPGQVTPSTIRNWPVLWNAFCDYALPKLRKRSDAAPET